MVVHILSHQTKHIKLGKPTSEEALYSYILKRHVTISNADAGFYNDYDS